jgi:beta-glucosidase
MTKIIAPWLLAAMLAGCASQRPSDPEAALDYRVDSLLKQMTLEEKLGQMNQITSWGNIEEMGALAKKGGVGSILNEIDPARINALQHVAVEESRLGIPILVSRDVIHGFHTMFPIPLGQAASFDPEVVRSGARVAAVEATAYGVRWTFAPMIDIGRDPRWGRVAEGYGEDVYLTSVMGAAAIRGFQGDSLNDPTSLAACAKHFVGYGATEGGRDYNSTFLSERTLRNTYLPPFEAAVKAGVATFMTSFNDNDGVPSTGNRFILKDVLRDEWQFKGFVVTDWESASEMIKHGFVADRREAALSSLNAGVDMEMVSGTFFEHGQQLIQDGLVKESDIDEAVRRILRVKFQLGLFEHPYVVEQAEDPSYSPAHLEAAKEAAVKSIILLKNDNQTLPFTAKLKTLAVVGPLADAPYEQMGTWSFDGQKEHTVTPLAALREAVGQDVRILYEPGLAYSRAKDAAGIQRAVAVARQADAVLCIVGEEAILSGEAHSLADLNLQGDQSALVKALSATGKPVVTVVMAGRPLTIADEVEASSAVMYAFHPGTMGGPALTDLLWGRRVPSAKTPISFPRMTGQVPVYYSHHHTGRPAQGTETLLNDIPVEAGQTSLGCTSFYLDAGFGPLFPFGYGLSYTQFSYGPARLDASTYAVTGQLTATCDITNTGDYEADEVVELYIEDKVGSLTRPVKELKRFTRVTLKPGEKQTVTFTLPISELAFWTARDEYAVEPGQFTLWIAPDSQSGEGVDFEVK